RSEAEARLGERPVPVRLQHLHHSLLDEAVEHRWDAERPHAARRLRYLDPPHQLRLVGTLKQLSPDRGPVLLQVGRPAAPPRPPRPHLCCPSPAPPPSSGPPARQLLPSTVRRPPGVRDRLPPRALRSLERRRSGLHPSLRCSSSARPDSSAAWFARERPLYWP